MNARSDCSIFAVSVGGEGETCDSNRARRKKEKKSHQTVGRRCGGGCMQKFPEEGKVTGTLAMRLSRRSADVPYQESKLLRSVEALFVSAQSRVGSPFFSLWNVMSREMRRPGCCFVLRGVARRVRDGCEERGWWGDGVHCLHTVDTQPHTGPSSSR